MSIYFGVGELREHQPDLKVRFQALFLPEESGHRTSMSDDEPIWALEKKLTGHRFEFCDARNTIPLSLFCNLQVYQNNY